MKYYQEFRLLPNPADDVPINLLWSQFYFQLHKIWFDYKKEKKKVCTGVSFPQYDNHLNSLGCKLRIFASTRPEVEVLRFNEKLSLMKDYVAVSDICAVPQNIESYAYFKRVQTKSSIERLARRKARHTGMSHDEALNSLKDKRKKHTNAPFIHMKSGSSGKTFRLFISREVVCQEEYSFGFSTYGLSSASAGSTVPLF